MKTKKSLKADLENKKILFVEVGLIVALAVVLGAFEYKTYERNVSMITAEIQQIVEEEQIPITMAPPPPPPEVPTTPVLSDAIEIVNDDIIIEEDVFIETEDDASFAVEIRDYIDYKEEEAVEEEEIPLAIVEEKPSFKGGDENTFTKWVLERIIYPQAAMENGVEGRVVLSFIVDADGYVKNVTVLRGVDPSIDKEAIRVVSSSPRWKPGRQRDRNVRVPYNFPLNFQIR